MIKNTPSRLRELQAGGVWLPASGYLRSSNNPPELTRARRRLYVRCWSHQAKVSLKIMLWQACASIFNAGFSRVTQTVAVCPPPAGRFHEIWVGFEGGVTEYKSKNWKPDMEKKKIHAGQKKAQALSIFSRCSNSAGDQPHFVYLPSLPSRLKHRFMRTSKPLTRQCFYCTEEGRTMAAGTI